MLQRALDHWRWLVAAVALVGVAAWALPECAVQLPPGAFAPDEPVQENLDEGPVWTHEEYLLTALARYELQAKVLSKERYWWGGAADLSPIDLALGWGPMSDQDVVDAIDISQSNRWYHWQTDSFPISREQIAAHSANVHIIPATDEVLRVVKKARVGEILFLQGHLVQAEGDDGFVWRSSLSRTDTGAHSCELFRVEQARRLDVRGDGR